MRSFRIFIAAVCLGFITMATQAFVYLKNENPAKTSTDKGFAVVELFTSEGCSSCPPADALVARVQKESGGQPVYILAYHVDYWDRLGWKDAFSSSQYSDRQKQYARWFKLSSYYTPQIVVNGRTEFVGSEEDRLRTTIKSSLQKAANAELTLNDIKVNGVKATLQYHTSAAAKNISLVVALIEKNATTKVQSGENGGRTLSHVQIVTQLKTAPISNNSGTETIALPRGFNAEKWEIIGFVQNNMTGEITGATKAAFQPAASANTIK
jgi:hypothetical protein